MKVKNRANKNPKPNKTIKRNETNPIKRNKQMLTTWQKLNK